MGAIIFIGVMIAILFGTIQFHLCKKRKKIWIKLMPVYVIVFFALLAVALYNGVFGMWGWGGEIFLAMFIAFWIIAAIIGDIVGWSTSPMPKDKDEDLG